jgi:hypothetical protein
VSFPVCEFVVWLRVQNGPQEIRQNRDILNRVRLSWARGAEACIANNGRHFQQLHSQLLTITVFF